MAGMVNLSSVLAKVEREEDTPVKKAVPEHEKTAHTFLDKSNYLYITEIRLTGYLKMVKET